MRLRNRVSDTAYGSCCGRAGAHHANTSIRRPGRLAVIAKWLTPSLLLVLMPKCPACLAAYIALGTGVSLSFPVAAQLRLLLMTVCITALVLLAVHSIHRKKHRAA